MPSKSDELLTAPPLTSKTTLLSFDIESNGLHGPAFAVGALVMRADETVLSEFTGRCPIKGEVDDWVAENVLPSLKDFPVNYKTAAAMRQAFWKWFLEAKASSDFVLVSNGYPVEMRWLIDCQEDDIEERYWQHPYPLIELNSILFAIGADSRHKIVADKLSVEDALKHNPRWDAWVSALAAFKALKLAGRLKA